MIGLASCICLLLIASEVIQVQCEPSKFVEENKELYDVVYEHASQKYTATKRKIDEENFKVSGTEAKKVWMYIRHGTRSLKRSEIPILRGLESVANQIVASFQNDKSVPFTQNGWNKLKTWKLDLDFEKSSHQKGSIQEITTSGKAELELIAVNYKNRFPNLFTKNYSTNTFHLLHSDEDRGKKSMEIFFGQIFGQNVGKNINGTAGGDYKGIVEAYRVYKESPQSGERPKNVELPKFHGSAAYKAMVERIFKKFRLKANDDSDKQKLVSDIFDMCRYEEAWYSNRSVWCSFFEANDILMLQYAVDLYNFYEWGYGFDQNEQIQCPTIRDMVKSLREGTASVSAYFSHIPEISLHLVAMHAYPEHQKLTADNYHAMSKRVWQSSKLVPFAANFAAVLYGNKQVKFFMNEELVELSWCKKGVCNLEDLEDKFSHCYKKQI